MAIKSDNYIVVQGWMYYLGLEKLNELLAIALVYGFSQDGESQFKGSISYIADHLMCDKSTAIRVMKKLEERGLVEKTQKEINGVKFNRYIVPEGVVAKYHYQLQNATGGSCKMQHNNTNNKTSNIIIVEDAHTHTREKSDFDLALEWICDNGDGLQLMLYRNNLIFGATPADEMKEIVKPYVQEYYEQQVMNGGEDIMRRGRRDIKQHFSQWLPKHLKKLQQEQQQKQQEYEQGIDPITRAMQDFAAGWDNAERRKQQEQCFECF